ncbi:MAG: hypothetical protein CL609_05320 [Anaerolineaceae bacterium]|nr:hypothetical protein [Anaerolineaceae bacterium]
MKDHIDILIFDPDETNAQGLSGALNNGRYRVTIARDEQDAIACIRKQEFEIAIFDLRLPQQQLFKMIDLLKNDQPALSIVLTSDHSNPEIMIQAIRYQVGDFLLRPFEDEFLLERLDELTQKQQVSKQKEECLERLQELMDKLAVIKNTTNHNDILSSNPDSHKDQILQVGNFILDLETRQVFVSGSCEFHLTTTNFNYLKVLAIHAPRAVSFTNLVQEAQGYTLSKQEAKSLAFWHIYKLRKELTAGLDYDVIQNVRGFGYKLNVM